MNETASMVGRCLMAPSSFGTSTQVTICRSRCRHQVRKSLYKLRVVFFSVPSFKKQKERLVYFSSEEEASNSFGTITPVTNCRSHCRHQRGSPTCLLRTKIPSMDDLYRNYKRQPGPEKGYSRLLLLYIQTTRENDGNIVCGFPRREALGRSLSSY
ncbi:unnamed protein product [Calypogeia fissa]